MPACKQHPLPFVTRLLPNTLNPSLYRSPELFLGNIANGWDVQNDQRDETKFRNQDLQVGMSAGTSGTISASMKHKMGLIQVNMPSQTVYLTRYYQYLNNKWELNDTKNSNAANQTTASGATDFTNSTWKPWAKTTSSCYLIGKPDDGALPISANRGTSNSYYSWEVTDKEITAANAIVTENLSISSTYLKQAWEFSYTGTGQSFTIPAAGTYCFECWGAQGGNTTYGGKGGYSKGNIHLINETFYVYVGGTTTNKNGGWNGGGNGGLNDSEYGGYGAGGATDIRVTNGAWNNTTSLNSRIIIAGGGGGSDYWTSWASGGYGGGISGGYGTGHVYSNSVSPGTQIKGGVHRAVTLNNGTDGSFGIGGSGCLTPTAARYGGGGGGGYWGGAGGSNNGPDCDSGSGGSGFVSGHSGCIAIKSASSRDPRTESNTIVKASHYSGYVFITGTTILASGNESIPQTSLYDSSNNETGHSGHGFARITQITTD